MCENLRKNTFCHYVLENNGDRRFVTTSQIFVSHSHGVTYIDFLNPGKNPEGRLAIMCQKHKGLVENRGNGSNFYIIENKVVNQVMRNVVVKKRGLKNEANFL
jgi:hypothetical protein